MGIWFKNDAQHIQLKVRPLKFLQNIATLHSNHVIFQMSQEYNSTTLYCGIKVVCQV